MESDARDTRGGTRGRAEEIHEDAFLQHGVLIGENSYRALVFEDFQHGARGFILENGLIAGKAAVTVDQSIEARIVDGTRHIVQWETVQGVSEGRKFPRADVAGEVQNAFTTLLAGEEVFVAVEDDELLDILLGVFGKAREFGGHPAEIADHLAGYFAALGVVPFRECEAQIKVGDLAEFVQNRETGARDGGGYGARQGARQGAEDSYDGNGCGVLEPIRHLGSIPRSCAIWGAASGELCPFGSRAPLGFFVSVHSRGDKVLCFDTVSQVFILEKLANNFVW